MHPDNRRTLDHPTPPQRAARAQRALSFHRIEHSQQNEKAQAVTLAVDLAHLLRRTYGVGFCEYTRAMGAELQFDHPTGEPDKAPPEMHHKTRGRKKTAGELRTHVECNARAAGETL